MDPQNQILVDVNPYEWPEEIKFLAQLTDLGFAMHRESTDGNCLFRCVAHIVLGNADFHQLVRTQCVALITFDRWHIVVESLFGPRSTPTGYKHHMRLGEYGGEPEIANLSFLFNMKIFVHRAQLPVKIYGVELLFPAGSINLSYHSARKHYNLLTTRSTAIPFADLPLPLGPDPTYRQLGPERLTIWNAMMFDAGQRAKLERDTIDLQSNILNRVKRVRYESY